MPTRTSTVHHRVVATATAVACALGLAASCARGQAGNQPGGTPTPTVASESPGASPTATASPVPSFTPPLFTLPKSMSFYGNDACRTTATFPGYAGAAAYAGPAPHPIVFVLAQDGRISWPDWPNKWQTSSPAKVQLLGCVRYDPGTYLRKCSYNGPNGTLTAKLYAADYTIEVYEAATGKLLRTASIHAGSSTCPGAVYASPTNPLPDLYSKMPVSSVRGELGDLIE